MNLKLLLNTQMIRKDIYKNVDEYNPNKKCKILLVFYDMISDILSNKKT